MGAFVLNQRDGMARKYTRNGEYWVEGTELNDTIVNGGYYDSYDYYSLQADHYHRGDKATISGYEGSDKILNYGDKVYIHGGKENDSIRNHFGKYVTICGGEGDDTVICQGEGLELIEYEPGDGNDVIYNFFDEEGQGTPENSDYECIYITSGDKVDNAYFNGSDFVLKIGDGSITLKDAKGKKFDIQDSADNGGRSPFTKIKVLQDSSTTEPDSDDTLPPDDNVIYGTPNDDTLETDRDHVRVEALGGNDDIKTHHINVTVNGDEGNDNIQSYGKKTSLVGGKGDDFLEIWSGASDATIKAGEGNDDILLSGGISASADGGAGDDNFWIWLGSKNATVDGGDGKDSFEIGDESLLAYGGNGNDTFYATSGKNSTLYGDAGNDYILLRDTKTKFFGGKGDDTIRIKSEAVDATINGGEDSDTFIINLSTYNGQARTGNSAVIQDYESSKDKIVLEETSLDSYSIDSSDVILTLKSENISDYKLTLKNTKEKEITFIDSDGNTSTKIYKDENISAEDEPYWTSEDLQTFLDAVNFVAPPSMVKLSAWTDISSKFTGILKSAIDIANGNKSVTDLKSEFIKLVGAFASIKGDVKSLKGLDSTLWTLAGSGIGGVASWIKAFDVAKIASTEEDRKKLQEDIDKAVEGTADIVSDISGVIIDKIFENNLSASEIRSLAGIKLNLKLKFGVRATIALVMVGYYGANQYRESIQKYSAEELPLAMTAEATFVDVIVSALHGGAHYVSLGLDDLAFKGLRWAYFKVTGQKPVNSDKDYMEWIGEVIKRGIFGSSSADDTLETDHNEETLYAQGGDDYIQNVFSNVKIYGGEGNDTIFSHEGARRNYLNGNNGRDYIIANDTKSTVIGASGNDMLMSSGDGNSISGGEGMDFIFIKNASENIVNAGTGIDIIALENAQNTVIYYAKGDGSDIIFGCDGDDTIHIAGKTEYSVIENGQDIYIKVGEDTIILNEAAGKNVKIENRDTADNPIDDINPFEANPIISNTISRISARATENVITDINSLNDLTDNRTSILTFTENSGRGIQNVNLRSSEYPQVVSLEGGNQNVQFNDVDGNVAIVSASATGGKEILFGNGTDVGIFTSPKANINTTLGSGEDSIITDNNARVRVDMTGNDEAQIFPYSGRVILDNYNSDSRAEIVIPDVIDITSAIKDNSIQLVGNEIRPNSSTRIEFNDSDDSNIVNLVTENGDTQKVGFTGINGGAVNASTLRGNFLLKGNYAEKSSDNQKNKPSTLISGAGHDTILAGARDFVDAGNGRNQIFLTPYELRQIKDGTTIVSSGDGRNTVHGFHEGFGYDGDVIQVNDFNNIKFKFDNDGLLLTSKDSRLKFDGIGITFATPNDSTNSLGTDRAELIQITNGSSTMRTAVAQTNQSILVQEDDYIIPNAFFGNRSGLNFSDYSGNIEINLADGTGKLGMWDATFSGINKLQAGDGMSTLIGDSGRNTLIAGNGYTSMWGGANNDTLIGKGGSSNKDGRTTFFFLAGDGHDVIYDFEFCAPDKRYSGIADKIDITEANAVTDVFLSGDDVVLQINDSNDYLRIKDAVGKDFHINNLIAKVDRKNLAYDGLANCYVAKGISSLTVDSSVGSAEIWLDSSHETFFLGEIRTLDASAVDGRTSLVGNEYDNTIIAGQGDSSLWGGFSSSNDLLVGGNSRNTFFYCMSNGNDTIQGTNDKDFVILADVSLDQIIETSITADSVSIRFNDGGSLQIQGTSDVTYQLADGSKYSANHQRLEWDSR